MHLCESYSLQAGQYISKPFIAEEFFPLPVEKYITIHPQTKPSKTYDHWNEVIDILEPILKANNLTLVQIGAKGDTILPRCYHVQGETTLNQCAYLVKNAVLHLSADTFSAHLAGHYNIPLVALYSNNYVHNVRPYFGDKSKQILLEPDRTNSKPSFAYEENPKTINTIKPELIAASVCKLLDIPFNFEYQTLSFGRSYGGLLVEIVPNAPIDVKSMNLNNAIMRMDLVFNEQTLIQQMSNSKVIIYTNKPISKDIITKFRTQIDEVIYIVDDVQDTEFIEFLRDNIVRYGLISFCKDEDKMNDLKLKYMDLGLIHKQEPQVVESKDNLYYKTTRFLFNGQKVYPCTAAFLADKPIPSLQSEICPIIDNEEFWKESGYFAFLKKA